MMKKDSLIKKCYFGVWSPIKNLQIGTIEEYRFWSPIPVSDWLIFCCGTPILHQKNEMEMMKTQTLLWKSTKKFMYGP